MNKNKNASYYMSDEDLKALKKSLEYVKKLDIFNKKQEKKVKIKKVA